MAGIDEVVSPMTDGSTDCCLVLMFKAPERSKRRLARQIGALAATAADLLLDCAVEDLAEWPGPVCLAPAESGDEQCLQQRIDKRALIVEQRGANLGERINTVNAALWSQAIHRQIFIGIDCPGLDSRYLRAAAAGLEGHDSVLGPAIDGGAVLIAARRLWPELGGLTWSSDRLLAELDALCDAQSWSTTRLPPLGDADSVEDLRALAAALRVDPRASRRVLGTWVDEHVGGVEA